MALADEIQALKIHFLSDLVDAHDYYEDTKLAWTIVRNSIKTGSMFSNENAITGTVTTQADLLAKANDYVEKQLTQATFQQFISIFESDLFDLLRHWLRAYPQNIMSRKVDIKTVLESPDKDAIILFAVNKELNEVLYERPAGWFGYLEEKLKLGCPTADEIERIAEAKASRDILVHNQGIAGKAYEFKAGKRARCKIGERIEIPEDYPHATWELVRKVVTEISDGAIFKAS